MDVLIMNKDVEEALAISPIVRFTLIIINMFFISFGLFFNICVLVSGVKKVMNLDKVTQLFIVSIAFTDVIIIIVSFCPMTLTLIANRWILGPGICYTSAHFFQKVPFIYEMMLITTISCYRLWMLKKPQVARQKIQTRSVVAFMTSLLIIAFCPSIVSIAINNYVLFDPETLNCVIKNHDAELFQAYSLTLVFMFLVIPIIIVVVANISMLYVVIKFNFKSGKIPNKTTIITILCVCWAFIISYFPVLIGLALRSTQYHLPPWYNILFNQINSIDVVANPFIYTLTNSNFRRFLRRKICQSEGNSTIAARDGKLTLKPRDMSNSNRKASYVLEDSLPKAIVMRQSLV